VYGGSESTDINESDDTEEWVMREGGSNEIVHMWSVLVPSV
jgi:hypothetical protein